MNLASTECPRNHKTKSINELMIQTHYPKKKCRRSVAEFKPSVMPLSEISSDTFYSSFYDQPMHLGKEKSLKDANRKASFVSDILLKTDKSNNELGTNKTKKTTLSIKEAARNATKKFVVSIDLQNVTSNASSSIDDGIMIPSSSGHSSYVPCISPSSIEEMEGTINKDPIKAIEEETTDENKRLHILVDTKGKKNCQLDGGRNNDYGNKKSGKLLAQCPYGECEVMVGSLQMLANAFELGKHDWQLNLLRGFIQRHKYGDETIRGVTMEDGAVQFVLLNFPSGMHVNGFEDDEVPFWNVVKPNLISCGLQIANNIVCDSGWVACAHTFEQSNEVKEKAVVTGFKLWRSFTVVCNEPIYWEVFQPKMKVYTSAISIFYRHGMPRPKPYYMQAGQLGHHQCSLSRDLIYEKMDHEDWLYKMDGTPWRGGAQRSDIIWRFLLLAFTRYADSVVDLIASTGGFIKLATELGRHALGVEADESIVHQVLQSYVRSNV